MIKDTIAMLYLLARLAFYLLLNVYIAFFKSLSCLLLI